VAEFSAADLSGERVRVQGQIAYYNLI